MKADRIEFLKRKERNIGAPLPVEQVKLAKRTRCLNPMDALVPGESFDADRLVAQLLKPEENGTGGDPFFSLSTRALITLLIESEVNPENL